jgi:hypothetical protein
MIPPGPRPQLVAIEVADDAMRVRHSGGEINVFEAPTPDALREFVESAAFAIAEQHLALPPF